MAIYRSISVGAALNDAFPALSGPLIEQVEADKRQNVILAQIADLLLPKLTSGEIRLYGAARLVEEAA